LIFKNLLTW
jgi:hypothetical protein